MTDNELRGVREVKIKRVDLVTKLKTNREAHAKIYADAMDGYFVEAAKKLTVKQKDIENKRVVSNFSFPVPKDHTADYDRIIAMLEMSVDDFLELSAPDFNRYVMDEWIDDAEKRMLRTYALSSSNSVNYAVAK